VTIVGYFGAAVSLEVDSKTWPASSFSCADVDVNRRLSQLRKLHGFAESPMVRAWQGKDTFQNIFEKLDILLVSSKSDG
jgi:hypothetical protein